MDGVYRGRLVGEIPETPTRTVNNVGKVYGGA